MMMISDSLFVKEIAALWVDLGGDADGLNYLFQRLKGAIEDEIESRNQESEE